jgi:hypothetical protein
MRNEVEGARNVAIGDGVEKICLSFAAPYANYSSYGILANFFIPSFHVASEFVELPGELVQIAPNCRLKELDCWPADPNL